MEVTEYWTSAKAPVLCSVTSKKLQAIDKIYDCNFCQNAQYQGKKKDFYNPGEKN